MLELAKACPQSQILFCSRENNLPTMIEDILEEEDPLIEVVDPQIMEDLQMVEDPLMMEDPLEMDDIQDTLEDEDHLVHQDPLDQ